MYYRNANCAVVVYDITQSTSLEKAKAWIRELQRQADPNIVIALCGNKLDLAARRQVSQEEAKKYAEEEGLMWGETSAKTGENVNTVFTEIGASCYPYHIVAGFADPPHSQEDTHRAHTRIDPRRCRASRRLLAARRAPGGRCQPLRGRKAQGGLQLLDLLTYTPLRRILPFSRITCSLSILFFPFPLLR